MSEAGLSHGLFYHYFESKERIFTELATIALHTSGQAIMDAARLPDKSPWERLVAMTEGIVPGAYQGIGPYYFLLVNQAFTSESVPEEVRKLAAEQTTWYTEYMVPLIVEGQQKGEIAAGDPYELAMAYFSMLQGIAVNKVQGGAAFPIPSTEIILRIFQN